MPTLRIIFDIATHKELKEIFFNQHTVPQISSESLKQILNENKVPITLIDVRYPKEFAKMHKVNSINTPMDKIVENPEMFITSKDEKIIVLCSNGRRSGWITQFLLERKNFSNVSNLESGINHWTSQGYEIVKEK